MNFQEISEIGLSDPIKTNRGEKGRYLHKSPQSLHNDFKVLSLKPSFSSFFVHAESFLKKLLIPSNLGQCIKDRALFRMGFVVPGSLLLKSRGVFS